MSDNNGDTKTHNTQHDAHEQQKPANWSQNEET